MKKEALQKLCQQTALALRDADVLLGRQQDTITKQSSEIEKFHKEQRVRTLAKTAVARGIINDDVDSVDEFIASTMGSSRPLDVIEQGLDFATSGGFSSVKEASEDEDTGLGKGDLDPIASLVLGHMGMGQ